MTLQEVCIEPLQTKYSVHLNYIMKLRKFQLLHWYCIIKEKVNKKNERTVHNSLFCNCIDHKRRTLGWMLMLTCALNLKS